MTYNNNPELFLYFEKVVLSLPPKTNKKTYNENF